MCSIDLLFIDVNIPDGENASSLGKTGLFLYTSNTLFKDGGDLSRSSFRIGSVGSDLFGGSGKGCYSTGSSLCCSQIVSQLNSSLALK